MVLVREFDSQVCLKTKSIRWPLDGRKTKIIKTAKRGKSHQKNIFKNECKMKIKQRLTGLFQVSSL
jgi:hypothetical protein